MAGRLSPMAKNIGAPSRSVRVRAKDGMADPVKVYIPSIAPGSLLLYSGKSFAKWQGNLFSGALVMRHLNRVVVGESGEAVQGGKAIGGSRGAYPGRR